MKINLDAIDQSQFYVNEHVLNGQMVFLIIPRQMGATWTPDNMHFRSSVWSDEGLPVSLSFKKFFNFGEKPELSPLPKNLDGSVIVEKKDGSTLILSKWNGNFIFRTRGAIDVSAQPNGGEIEILKQKYPKLLKYHEDKSTWDFSILTEWVTPTNKIVVKYNEVDFVLIGHISHNDYSLMEQSTLDALAKELEMPRPATYEFSSIEDLLSNVDKWENKEGVVLYCKQGQQLLKIKAMSYLIKHRFKSQATLENTLELFFSLNKPSYQDFEKLLIDKFDYECFEMVRGFISIICDASKEVQKIVEGMDAFVKGTLKPLSTRREQAEKVLSSYGNCGRTAMVFTCLDNKPLSNDQLKKLFWQVLKS